MSALRKEWTDNEIRQLGHDMNVAKVEVLTKHGFTPEEIEKVLDIPVSVILRMLKE